MATNNEVEEGPWSDLTEELLELIMKRLSFVDQISFSVVCKSWSLINRFPPPQNQKKPWLMVFDDTHKHTWSSCKLVDPTTKKTYTFDIKSLKKNIKDVNTMKVHESKYGWLLISSQQKQKFTVSEPLFVYTPFISISNSNSNDDNNINLIELPTLNFSKSFEFATFSSNPLSEDCLFLTLNLVSKINSISIKTCRRGDNSWTSLNVKCDFPLRYLHNEWSFEDYIFRWVYSEGLLYYLSDYGGGTVGSFDINRKIWSVFPPLPDIDHDYLRYYKIHIVKSVGELILINGNQGTIRNDWCFFYGCFLRLDLVRMTWKCEHFREYEESNITCFAGSGYCSVLTLCDEKEEEEEQAKVYYCMYIDCPELSLFKSFLNRPGLELYGSIAAQCNRKLWIDPVVSTSSRSRSSSSSSSSSSNSLL